MKNSKKIVSILLAILMIFSSLSVLAADLISDGTLTVKTEIVGKDGKALAKTAPGTEVEIRVYVGTDYYTTAGQLRLEYDKDFFEPVAAGTAVDCSAYNTANGITISAKIKDVTLDGDSKGKLNIDFDTTNNKPYQYDVSSYLCSFKMTVKNYEDWTEYEKSGTVTPADAASLSNRNGYTDFVLCKADEGIADGTTMKWLNIDAAFTASAPVSVENTVNFYASTVDAKAKQNAIQLSAIIGETVTVPSESSILTYVNPADYANKKLSNWGAMLGDAPVIFEGENLTYAAGASYEMTAEDVYFVAKWVNMSDISVQIRYYVDGVVRDAAMAKVGSTYTVKNVIAGVKYTAVYDAPVDEDGKVTAGGKQVTTLDITRAMAEAGPVNLYTSTKLVEAEYGKEYTVILNANGGVFETSVPELTLKAGEPIAGAYGYKVPTRYGYNFLYWTEDQNGEGRIDVCPEAAADTITVYAKWAPKAYEITYNIDDKTKTVLPSEYPDSIATPVNPDYDGKVFKGWSIKDNAEESASYDLTWDNVFKADSNGDGKLDAFPKFNTAYVTVTYFVDGKYAARTTAQVDSNYKVDFSIGDTLYTKMFTEYKDSECTGTSYTYDSAKDTLIKIEGKAVNLYTSAKYIESSSSGEDAVVTFDPKGGKFADGVKNTVTGKIGDVLTFTAVPKKTGYLPKSENGKIWFDENGAVAPDTICGTTTYYIIWEPAVYKFNYYEADMTTVFKTTSGAYGDDVPHMDGYEPTAEKKTFKGWFLDTACKTAFADDWTKLIATDTDNDYVINIYPKFEAKIEVTLDANGGSFTGEAPVLLLEPGDALTSAENYEEPTKTGNEFVGWAQNKDGTGIITTCPEANQTIFAVFEPITYYVTFTALDDDTQTVDSVYEPEELIGMPFGDDKWDEEEGNFTWMINGTDELTWENIAANAEYNEESKQWEVTVVAVENESDAVVKLMPVAGSTTMIERNFVVETVDKTLAESYAAANKRTKATMVPNGVTNLVEAYSDVYDKTGEYATVPANFDGWFVYGLKAGIKANELDSYITLSSDAAEYHVYRTISGRERDITGKTNTISTGTRIEVTLDGVLVETFYVVIYGDVDMDSLIAINDVTILEKGRVGTMFNSASPDYSPYQFRAANLDQNALMSINDVTSLEKGRVGTINQITGRTE